MKKGLFISFIVFLYSCGNVQKIAEYKLENKKDKTFYPYTDDLRIRITSDTSGIFINRMKKGDTIIQKFTYCMPIVDNKRKDVFGIVESVDYHFENDFSLQQRDTLIFFKKGIYIRYKASNTTQYLLYFKR